MMIWPKYSSSPSILTRRSIASLMESSRPLWTLTTYHCLRRGLSPMAAGASAGAALAASAGGSPPTGSAGGIDCSADMSDTLDIGRIPDTSGSPGLVAIGDPLLFCGVLAGHDLHAGQDPAPGHFDDQEEQG